MIKKDIEKLREALEAEKKKLTSELESFAVKDKELSHNWSAVFPNKEKGDIEEEAGDAVEYEQLVALEQKMEIKLKDVKIALDKISKGAKGAFGICEKCGKKIEKKRLEAFPEARLCMECNQ